VKGSGIRIGVALIALVGACSEPTLPADENLPLPERDDAGTAEPGTVCGDAGAGTVDLASDPKNCGACGKVCAAGAHTTATCEAGTCVSTCAPGFGDCNGQPDDGCEADLAKDLLDCGACGRGCAACGGTVCTDGMCDAKTIVTSTEPGVTHVALDAVRVYFITGKNVQQVEKDGSKPAVVFGATNSTGVGADTLVDVVQPGTGGASGIYRTSAGFVGPQAPVLAAGRNVVALTVDTTGIYYAAEKSAGLSEVTRCNNCGANPTVLIPNAINVGVAGIALDGTTVFVGAGDTIQRVEKTAADFKTLVVGQTPRSLSTDATYVYWINGVSGLGLPGGDAGPPKGEVARMPKSGGAVEKIATSLRAPQFLAASSSGVYVTDRGLPNAKDGTLVRLSPDGKSRLILARDLAAASGVAIDDACVYFGDASTVKKVAR
jgi:hypothetical protein